MELENKQFRMVVTDNIKIIDRRLWESWWIDKDQLDALIDILTQLKEEIDGK